MRPLGFGYVPYFLANMLYQWVFLSLLPNVFSYASKASIVKHILEEIKQSF